MTDNYIEIGHKSGKKIVSETKQNSMVPVVSVLSSEYHNL